MGVTVLAGTLLFVLEFWTAAALLLSAETTFLLYLVVAAVLPLLAVPVLRRMATARPEVGEAVHSLALRLVAEGLAGYALGGLVDERVKRLLGLDGSSAQIALGYACGIAA